MLQIKKTILTLVALLAVTTGAWADGIVCTASDLGKVLCTDGSIYENVSAATTAGKTAVAMIAYVDETNKNSLAIALADEALSDWSTAKSTCEDKPAVSGAAWLLPSQDQWKAMFVANGDEYSCSGLNKAITTAGGTALQMDVYYWSSSEYGGSNAYTVFLGVDDVTWDSYKKNNALRVRACLAIAAPSAASGPEVAWDKAEKTGSFTMPGGNVELEPEYYPQATVADGGVTAADADARATTDDPLVKVDATKLTGAKKLMYFVSNSGTTAPAYDAEGWTDQLPTAEGFTQQGIVYVWYYPVGIDEGVDGATATYSDGDICLQSITARIAAAPTYAVTFAEGTDPNEWTASPAANVTKGQPVTVTYTGTKKVLGVKAEKKAAGPLAAAFKDGAKFKVGYQWNGGFTTYLEFTNSGGTYSLTSVSGANELNGFNSSTLTVKDGNVLALDVVCHPEGDSKIDDFSAQIEFDATSSTYKYSSKGGYFDGIISVSVNDTDITSQLTPAN